MRAIACIVSLLTLAVAGPAQATLVGDNIFVLEAGLNPPQPPQSKIVYVDVVAGVTEIDNGFFGIDIESESITVEILQDLDLTVTSGFEFFGFVFGDLDWVDNPGTIVGFDVTTNMPGMGPGNVLFSDDQISVDIKGQNYLAGDFVTLGLQVTHIPLPPALMLMAGGLLGLLRCRRAPASGLAA